MKDKEILEKAIQKARARGWTNKERWIESGWEPNDIEQGIHLPLIFNHDFAKALWSKQCKNAGGDHGTEGCIPWWRYNLQQMVIADDPIKYLGEHLA